MRLTDCLRHITLRIQDEEIPFAIAGGLAASLYRAEPRLTRDIDLVIALNSPASKQASGLLTKEGFSTRIVRQAEFEGGPLFAIKRKSTPVVMVVGRRKNDPDAVGADLLLQSLPWAPSALSRAADHQVDFGFGPLPVLTVEDVILSKLSALAHAVNRPKDLDDLLSIYEANPQPDLVYLRAELDRLNLVFPSQTKSTLPGELRTLV